MPFCDRCSKNVPSYKMDEHRRLSGKHWFCQEHLIDYTSWAQLQAHYAEDKEHHYCRRCNVHYEHRKYLLAHLDTAHYFCREHREVFKNWEMLKTHYTRSADHFFCPYCNEHFNCREDLVFHGESYHFVCAICVKLFANTTARDHHNSQVHARQHCKSCNHVFGSIAVLEKHRNQCPAATASPESSVMPSLTTSDLVPELRRETDSGESDDDSDSEDDYGQDGGETDEHGVLFSSSKPDITSHFAVVTDPDSEKDPDRRENVQRVKAPRSLSWLSLIPLSPSSISLSSANRQRTLTTPTAPASPLENSTTATSSSPEKKTRKGFKLVASLGARVRSITTLH